MSKGYFFIFWDTDQYITIIYLEAIPLIACSKHKQLPHSNIHTPLDSSLPPSIKCLLYKLSRSHKFTV